ncbi:MFS transporter [Burkholderia pseudomallei]|uniref:MFS transporter n=1 Tax=Burkholderia pseudomallei TaxID=28450 RepID=UPI00061CA656|nr:MFS transporter [Burkholderia pseudomallei]OMR78951.1 MFS transporter [Burkholderia pseudomallei]CPE64835.1 putative sugar transporter [Burkholderia pseudomallei]VBE69753.1 putative sugar transporter [Burkholderia pseudomallei]VBK08923.1 putative sugar transporter [Burkholderia pseudomallei]VBO90501.1 putative sugar transporter [Burkholderia pseudomallei]
MRSKSGQTLKIALTANLFEWYEFSLTAFMALEIGRLFFPDTNEKTALISSFSVFASSYLARPIGSILFGILGARYGTGASLKISMIGMAVPASLIAVLPTYQTAGHFATFLLLALKITQGFCAGGEMPLSGYFVSLNADRTNRGLYCALTVASGFIGTLLASAAVFLLPHIRYALDHLASPENYAYLNEPWRWPFFLCMPLSISIYLLRSAINKSEVKVDSGKLSAKPTFPLLQSLAVVAFAEIVIYIIFVWMPNYLHVYLGKQSFDARLSNISSLIIFSISMACAGYAERYFCARNIALFGTIATAISVYPSFIIMQYRGIFALLFSQAILAISAGCVVGVIFVVLPDLFKKNWGSLGMVVTYSFATAIFGGTAPVFCAYLIELTHFIAAPAIYIFLMGMLAAAAIYKIYPPSKTKFRYRAPNSV